MSIQRWTAYLSGGVGKVKPSSDGGYVLYSDHVKAVEEARREGHMGWYNQPGMYDEGFEAGREQGHREANEALYHKGVADERKRIREAVVPLRENEGMGEAVIDRILAVIDGSETDDNLLCAVCHKPLSGRMSGSSYRCDNCRMWRGALKGSETDE